MINFTLHLDLNQTLPDNTGTVTSPSPRWDLNDDDKDNDHYHDGQDWHCFYKNLYFQRNVNSEKEGSTSPRAGHVSQKNFTAMLSATAAKVKGYRSIRMERLSLGSSGNISKKKI